MEIVTMSMESNQQEQLIRSYDDAVLYSQRQEAKAQSVFTPSKSPPPNFDLVSRHCDSLWSPLKLKDPTYEKLQCIQTPIKPRRQQYFQIGPSPSLDQSLESECQNSQDLKSQSSLQDDSRKQTERRDGNHVLQSTPKPVKPPHKPKYGKSRRTRADDRVVTCNCRKSLCLKLYCDCYAQGKVCNSACNCYGCHNNEEHQDERITKIAHHMDRNPHAFDPKVQEGQQRGKHTKGCNCRKSGCQKKYCECYQAGVKCSGLCKCEECKNLGDECRKRRKLQ